MKFSLTSLKWVGVLCTAFPLLAIGQTTEPPDTRTVKVTGGEVRGIVQDGIAAFKGIPFAAPPVGNLRWKAPQPVVPWDSVRDAFEFAPAPIQPPSNPPESGPELSEDCLYLNVWTPAKSPDERLPVMVWIYGGAFAGGSTSGPVTDGRFAKKGVVMVSIAYRVGPLGFLAHPELSAESGKGSGCYGIQDQIAGLRWVRDNIANFGGDPSRVTIFGGSAGAISVGILAASPPAKGLFHRAISQSGGAMTPLKHAKKESPDLMQSINTGVIMPSLKYAEEQGAKFLATLGVADIRAARALDAETIQKPVFDATQKGELDLFWPVADGETIVGDPYDLFQRGLFNDTPILIGTNSDDSFPLPTDTPELFEKMVREDFPLAADEILAAFPHATNEEALRSGKDLMREALFAWPTWAWATVHSQKAKNKAFVYYFDHGFPGPGNIPHGGEILYVFGALDVATAMNQPALGPTPENVAMSDLLMSYWVNFAANGDPNGPGLPHWPAYDTKSMDTMIFNAKPHIAPTPNLEKLKAFDVFYARIRERG